MTLLMAGRQLFYCKFVISCLFSLRCLKSMVTVISWPEVKFSFWFLSLSFVSLDNLDLEDWNFKTLACMNSTCLMGESPNLVISLNGSISDNRSPSYSDWLMSA